MLEKFSKFIGIQGVMALALTAGVLTLALTGKPVPAVLENLSYAAAGFYFGSKGAQVIEAAFRIGGRVAGYDYWKIPVKVPDKRWIAVNPGGQHYHKTVRIGQHFFQLKKQGAK